MELLTCLLLQPLFWTMVTAGAVICISIISPACWWLYILRRDWVVHVPSEPQVSLYSISRSELVGVHRTRTLMICCTSRCCPWISRLAQKALNTSVHCLLLGVFATEDLVEQVTAWSITKRSCGSKKSLAGKYILMHYSTFAYLLLRAPQKAIFSCCCSQGQVRLGQARNPQKKIPDACSLRCSQGAALHTCCLELLTLGHADTDSR